MPHTAAAPARTPDRIEKSAELHVPVSRVWRAVTDHNEFGAWFRVKLAEPFRVGEESHGQILYPGYEHITWRAMIQQIDPEQFFAFTWHPYAVDPQQNYSEETPTLVEFHLEPIASGTRVTLTESGFSDLPDERRNEAFLRNNDGWTQQMKNLEDYLSQNA
ncbi:MAG: SRPBCC family protein [Acidobacteriaceae bacterium]